MNRLYVSLAYKYVAATLMLGEANHCSQSLHLTTALPIQESHIREIFIGPPRLVGQLGSVDTQHYSYGFGNSGRLRFITKLNAFEKQPLRELHMKLAKLQSSVDTNQAYQLATNWLAAVDIDIAALETKYSPTVQQRFFYGSQGVTFDNTNRVLQMTFIPIFDVTWGRSGNPAVVVSVYGPTRELLQLRQNEESFSRRQRERVKNIEELLAIPDSDFLQLTPTQRSNLVAKFTKPLP